MTNLNLSNRQLDQAQAYYQIAEDHGKWGQGHRSEGAHYFDGEDNPFIDEDIVCGTCVFFEDRGACQIVTGRIDPEGLCKLWIISNTELGG